jgi:tRNA A-37 threonylcarbamoyl transferase component Bud32
MSEPTVPDNDRQRRLEEAMAEYLIAADAGRPPEPESFLDRYPDLRAELAEFLADRSALAEVVEPLLSAAALPEPRATPEPIPTLPSGAVTTEGGAPMADCGVGLDPTLANETTGNPAANATFAEGPPGGEASGTMPGGTRIRYFGDYELLKVLGRGGMGVVYKARQLSLNRPVALKMLRAGILAAEDDLRRFQNEAEAVALLDHPNIVPILEVGQYQGQRYFSMKLIVGPSLDRKLGEYTTNPKAAARLIRTLAEAVNHAHRRGILHRDLKPGNILLDERGEPHVTDFGLAKRVQADSELTQSGAILGTPAYMAPEQASGQRGMVTIATDICGLGASLYALLTGHAPFSGDSPLETLEQVRTRMPEPPRRTDPRVARDLQVIAMKCLEKDPTHRYASAQALAEDLGRYLVGKSIDARPVGLATRDWMWCKRKPVLAGLASALTIALLIALFGGIGVAVVERGRRREADACKGAEMSFTMAQQAVEDYMTSVSENTLLKEQDSLDSRGLRRELLEDALKYYQRFVRQRSGDPLVRRELAKAYFRVGQITQEIESPRACYEL